jgi:hypothetical protein
MTAPFCFSALPSARASPQRERLPLCSRKLGRLAQSRRLLGLRLFDLPRRHRHTEDVAGLAEIFVPSGRVTRRREATEEKLRDGAAHLFRRLLLQERSECVAELVALFHLHAAAFRHALHELLLSEARDGFEDEAPDLRPIHSLAFVGDALEQSFERFHPRPVRTFTRQLGGRPGIDRVALIFLPARCVRLHRTRRVRFRIDDHRFAARRFREDRIRLVLAHRRSPIFSG